ncbi:prostasin [Drosophila ficusphila]|uniref:prostasin n=1 Tax=Drosophila ficusphila TaxID=30025 RepID=UPI0007E5F36D|nr:prostasin [Drosophila ficusphila]
MRFGLAWFSLGFCLLSHLAASQFLEQPCGASVEGKIFRGNDANPRSAVWMAAIYNGSGFLCGGSLITKNFVLTAAHCVRDMGAMYVYLGAYDQRNPTSQIPVSKVTEHPEFNPRDYNNDIALLQLSISVDYSVSIQPVCISVDKDLESALENAQRFDVYGWGRTQWQKRSNILQTVGINRKDPGECYSLYGFSINPNQICAGGEFADACDGDSGGPLIVNVSREGQHERQFATQVGIVSFGLAQCTVSGVYTNVNRYVDWIKATVRSADPNVWLYENCSDGSTETNMKAVIHYPNFRVEGVLVTDKVVLTLSGFLPRDLTPLYVEVMGSPETYSVESIFGGQDGSSITLFNLRPPVRLTDALKPICVPSNGIPENAVPDPNLSIIGSTPNLGLNYKLNVQYIQPYECAHRLDVQLEENMFCVEDISASKRFGRAGDILVGQMRLRDREHVALLGLVTNVINRVHIVFNLFDKTDAIVNGVKPQTILKVIRF